MQETRNDAKEATDGNMHNPEVWDKDDMQIAPTQEANNGPQGPGILDASEDDFNDVDKILKEIKVQLTPLTRQPPTQELWENYKKIIKNALSHCMGRVRSIPARPANLVTKLNDVLNTIDDVEQAMRAGQACSIESTERDNHHAATAPEPLPSVGVAPSEMHRELESMALEQTRSRRETRGTLPMLPKPGRSDCVVREEMPRRQARQMAHR